MLRKPLGLLGVFMIIVGFGYFVGAGVAYSKVQGGYGSLQSFSEAQNVELSYNEDGQLIHRGTVEGAEGIMTLLKDDWNFPVVDSDMDPDDPLVNTASEYMFQMATIVFHVLHGEQAVTLTADDITAAIESEQSAADGTYNGSVATYQGQVLEPGAYTVPVDGRYWTGFARTDLLDGPARERSLERHRPRTGRRTRCRRRHPQHAATRTRRCRPAGRPRRGVLGDGRGIPVAHPQPDAPDRPGHGPRGTAPGHTAERQRLTEISSGSPT